MQRGRRLRRARALRDNVPYRLEIQSLDNPYAIRAALTDIAQALAAALDPASPASCSTPSSRSPPPTAASSRWKPPQEQPKSRLTYDNDSRIQEYPEFEKQFGLPPGADLDAETDAVLQKADEEAELRQEESLPILLPACALALPPTVFSAKRPIRPCACNCKTCGTSFVTTTSRKAKADIEIMKKEVMSATPAPERLADSA